MAGFFSNLRDKITKSEDYEEEFPQEDEYVELNTDNDGLGARVLVRPFTLEEFEDVKHVLNALREGRTIALINIKALKEKDLVELKRAINKLKKTTDAIEGQIAGFGDDYIVVCPAFAKIHGKSETQLEESAHTY